MMTATAPTVLPESSATAMLSQDEIALSDLEVLRRAHAIRSGWTLTERCDRRREADRRFVDLLDALTLPQEAA